MVNFFSNFYNDSEINDDRSVVSSFIYFVSTIIFFLTFNYFLNSWVFSGEMWAEMATNYYRTSIDGDFINQLFGRDAGYIPLLQRWITFISSLFTSDSSVSAYVYSLLALFISSLMVASFCLHYFRPLLKNDFLRFLVSITLLVVLDWETATFINFTYLNIFYISIFVALSFYKNAEDAPFIAYLIPLLIINKVYVLCILPILFIAVINAKKRYKKIFTISIVVAILHILIIIYSLLTIEQSRLPYNGADYSMYSKIISSFFFFGVYLARDLFGFEIMNYIFNEINTYASVMIGYVFIIVSLFTIYYFKLKASPLIIIGLSISFLTNFLNSMVNTPSYTINDPHIILTIYRHNIVGFIGFLFIFIGLLKTWFTGKRIIKGIPLSIAIFVLWLIIGKWFILGIINSKPGLITSKWQVNSSKINNAKITKPCIPLDPYPWVYNYDNVHCDYISKMTFGIGSYKVFSKGSFLTIPVIKNFNNYSVKSFMTAVKSFDNSNYLLNMELIAKTYDNKEYIFKGKETVTSFNKMIFLDSIDNIYLDISSIKTLKLKFDQPVIVWSNIDGKPIFSWMGVNSDERN